MNKKIELLAPAGDLEHLKAAFLYGADACYIGGKAFSLRSASKNFTLEEMEEGVKFAHSLGKKVYVAFNIYPSSFQENDIEKYLLDLDRINVDAIIVSSLYVMKKAKELGVKFELHVSTQESTLNNMAIEFFENYDVTRLVLGREASIEDIEKICANSKKEIEVFIHGAMCISYSGRCTLSNYYTGRDANKGSCSHPCRWEYELYKDDVALENKMLLGSKDLISLNYMERLIKAGVSSLKIEGRMRSINYLAHVIKTYRELIDSIIEEKEYSLEKLKKEIYQAGNYEMCEGYLKGYYKSDDLIYTFKNDPIQNYLGMVLGYEEKDNIAYIDRKNAFKVGDLIEIVSPKQEIKTFTCTNIFTLDNEEVKIANNSFLKYKIKIPFKCEKYDILRKKVN